MGDSNVRTTLQNSDVSVVSGITGSETNSTDNALLIEQKRRKIDSIFLSQQWIDEDEYKITKLRQVIRNHIFKHVKFVKGEGSLPTRKKDRKSQNLKKLILGKCHERPDLTRLAGYECQILKLVGLNIEGTSVSRRALWWKTYNVYVHQEIRQLRGRMNSGMKLSILEGKRYNDI